MLTADGEIAAAKRIERARLRLMSCFQDRS